MIDLHLHSTVSDGDVAPADVVIAAKQAGVTALSLTDHNGLWGIAEAHAVATTESLDFLAGIEMTASWQQVDVHILGYSQSFQEGVLHDGLQSTRDGYRQRIQAMVQLCQQAGFSQVSWADIEQHRQGQRDPCYVSYDVVRELRVKQGLSLSQARQLTVKGGECYVPYGSWALSLATAIDLIHQAGGLAVLAHPGIVGFEAGGRAMWKLVAEVVSRQIDGIEVFHPFHEEDVKRKLAEFCRANNLLLTGGSDWHGPDNYGNALGKAGVEQDQWQALQQRLKSIL
jgi:predicted metal-dependent phosphoesterase TrpH